MIVRRGVHHTLKRIEITKPPTSSWRWLRRVALPATPAYPLAMFSVTKAEATGIRDAFHQRGELSAVIELR